MRRPRRWGSLLDLWIPAGLCVLGSVSSAWPQRIEMDAPRRDVAQEQMTSVAALRSQVESLERANRELARRLDELSVLIPMGDDGKPGPDPGLSPESAPTAQEDEWRRELEFRENVLAVVGPELARLEEQIAALVASYEGHVHEYQPPAAMGWTTWRNVQGFGDNCPDCMIPFRSPQAASGSPGSRNRDTGPPKPEGS